jgi:hypothetical protein
MMLGGAVTWGHSLLLQSSHAAALAQCTQVRALFTIAGHNLPFAYPAFHVT